ncbi:hypothetical protein [Pseudomonas sp. NPDC096950]|uniref:hypothetical protein n=1 Tax=Pseudomonas sp. NPDC096950 TaxID=3364485 RepID=UPI00383AAD57
MSNGKVELQSRARIVCLAITAGLAIGFIVYWLSGSPYASCFASFIGYQSADLVLRGSAYRKTAFLAVKRHFQQSWFAILLGAFYLVVSLLFAEDTQRPETEFTEAVYSGFQRFGVLVLAFFAFRPIFNAGINGEPARYLEVIKAIACYFGMLWLLGHYGDQALEAAISSPESAAQYLLVVLLLAGMLWVGNSRNHSKGGYEYLISKGYATSSLHRNTLLPTTRDKKYTAAHESAHVMCFAALNVFPDDLRVVINERPDCQNLLGYVQGLDERCLHSKALTEWFMIMLLAGREGEALISNKPSQVTLGAIGDLARWQALAHEYLQMQDYGIYYCEPKTLQEQQRNELAQAALLGGQLKLLKEFLTMNKQIHAEISECLLDRQQINRAELIPFFEKVEFPSSFPRIYN